jgi:plasmid stabilization system protein ParE
VNVRIIAEADDEIDTQRQYLNQQRPGLGERFLNDLTETLNDIASRPYSFSKLETLLANHPFQRALLKKFRYVVVFEVANDEAVVVAVAHAGRAPNYWLKRRR